MGLSNTIQKGGHLRIIQSQAWFNWFIGFRGWFKCKNFTTDDGWTTDTKWWQ